MDDANGRTLQELARSTRTPPGLLADVLREEVARGRVELLRDGVYRQTHSGRQQLEPLLAGAASLSAIREPR